MTPRLRTVIDALYRPIPGRRVFALSRVEAEKLPRLSTVAVISITAPERPLACLDGFTNLLRLSFADVDHLAPDLSARAREKIPKAFTADQAKNVLSFVEGLPPDILSIVVHCEGGQSRSCAVAAVLHELYGYPVEPERLLRANPSVIAMLRNAAAGSRGRVLESKNSQNTDDRRGRRPRETA